MRSFTQTDRSPTQAAVRRAIVNIGVFSGGANILMLVTPLYLLQVYDRVLLSASMDTLIYITVIAVAGLIVFGLLEVARTMYASRVANRLDAETGTRAIYAAITDNQSPRANMQPLRDVQAIRGFINSKALFSLFDVPFVPFFLCLMYLVHPVLFYVTAVGAVLLLLLTAANQLTTRAQSESYEGANRSAMMLAQSFGKNTETLRAMGMTRNAIERWGLQFAEAASAGDAFQSRNAIFAGAARSSRMILQIAILGVGAFLVLRQEMTAGMIFAASIISSRALQPLDQIIGSWRQISTASAAWKRLEEVRGIDLGPKRGAIDLPVPKGDVVLEQVAYVAPNAKPSDDPILYQINLHIPPGQSVGLIGPSGAGKSTLARLMVGAIASTSGAVRLDGAELSQWDNEKIGRSIGYLAQQVDFYSGTIAENIARFDPDASSEAIVDAAVLAGAHSLILDRPDGYATILGDRETQFSGGERQRIGLARALFGNPKLVVLDEPNANLDAEGEAALVGSLKALSDIGATVVLITHKPSIAGHCERLIMLQDGRIEADGPSAKILSHLAPGNAMQKATGSKARQGGGDHAREQSYGSSYSVVNVEASAD